MITRIVKMSFRPEACEEFLKVFIASKEQIRNFEGCHGLKLLRSGNIFFTYSLWDHPSSLEKYRHSDLFERTWAQTKILFNDKPEAWSSEELYSL